MQATEFNAKKRELFEKYYGFLNPPQREAVLTTEGPLLVLAGAGSGKTTVLVNRIGNLILFGNGYRYEGLPNGADEIYAELCAAENGSRAAMRRALEKCAVRPPFPYKVLCITFTNKAANEFKERLGTLLGERAGEIWAGTFHSICVRILRRHIHHLGYTGSFTIYDTDDQKKIVSAIMKRRHIDEKLLSIRSVLSLISAYKEKGFTPEQMDADAGRDERISKTAKIYADYSVELKESNALDFDDLILLTNRLFRDYPEVLDLYRAQFDYILVDEFQDTNPSQNELIRQLGSGKCNVCVVGDDDQSIYSFRGATVENILRFDETFPETKVIRLEQNYRSTGHILNAANAVIRHNEGRKGKNLWTDAGEGEPIRVERVPSQMDEAALVVSEVRKAVLSGEAKYSDFAVLYRVGALSNNIEQALVRNRIPYRICGGLRFNERREIKDVISYLSVAANPNDTVRLKRILNVPKRAIGETTVAKIESLAAIEHKPFFAVVEHAADYPELQKASKKLTEFAEMIREFGAFAETHTVMQTVEHIVNFSGYLAFLYEEAIADGDEHHEREQNVKEFLSTAKQFDETAETPTLTSFLEETALISDLDTLEEGKDAVTLMTVHSAKGLEFPNVFLVGFEDGLFPSMQAMQEGGLEEERRLCYVAITRAKKKLWLIHCATRMLYGRTDSKIPSRFLSEIPASDRVEPERVMHNAFEGGSAGTGHDRIERARRETASAFVRETGPRETSGYGSQTIFKGGDRVRHPFFGVGTIVTATDLAGDMLYSIRFDDGSEKRLMGSFAKLKKEE